VFDNRIFRCDKSDFYNDEILYSNKTHTDDSLKAIADAGFNGIWLRGRLRELVPGKLFSPYVEKSKERLDELCRLCQRAEKYGLGTWLYFTEPLGLTVDDPFWKDNSDIAGPLYKTGIEPPTITLCPSTSKVQDYLYFGFEKLFSAAILKGAILITASEQPSHCFSRVNTGPDSDGSWTTSCKCRRCAPKGPLNVISEIINTIHLAAKSANKDAKIIAWDWAWFLFCKAPYRELINKINNDVIIMADFERGGKVRRLGKTRTIEEYSLMYPGPSRWFVKQAQNLAGKRKLWAKLQINTTHELATAPNLPLTVSLYRKFQYLKKVKIDGFMASWNFGCSAETLNIFAVNQLSTSKQKLSEKQWLSKLAKDFFGRKIDANKAVKAWYLFQRACRFYPIGVGNEYLYFGLISYALAYPLKLSFTDKPLGPSWLKHEFGDRVENSLKEITLSQTIELLGRFVKAWSNALTIYDKAFSGIKKTERISKELGCAHYIGSSAASAYNIYRWYRLRKNKKNVPLSKSEIDIVKSEIENCQSALPFLEADSRLGFHGEAQYRMVSPETVAQKIKLLESYLLNDGSIK